VIDLFLLQWLCTTDRDCVSLYSSCVLLQWLCTNGSGFVSLDSSCVLLVVVVYHWIVVVYYFGKIPPYLRGSVDVSTSGRASPRLDYRPRDIGYIYHKGALVVNGPKHSPSLIMTRNSMDSKCLKYFPRVN
jgi:hypothetical protein